MKTRNSFITACIVALLLVAGLESAEGAFLVSVQTPLFYTELSPHGSWVALSPFGWVWRPAVARRSDWRPYYSSGNWMWTDYGWYWQSYYSWGNVPFHYGRWVLDGRHGWVWIPDGVWGPSWVSWRYSPGYCGWAPLPPGPVYGTSFGYGTSWGGVSFGITFDLTPDHYVFVPHQKVCSGSPDHHAIPEEETVEAFEQSEPVTSYRPVRDRIAARVTPGPSVGRPIAPPTTRTAASTADALRARAETRQASVVRPTAPVAATQVQAVRATRTTRSSARPIPTRVSTASARVAQARASQAASRTVAQAAVQAQRAQVQARIDAAQNRLAGRFRQ